VVSKQKVLIIVENLPVPFDRRVWLEATTLKQDGYEVSIICPTGKGFDKPYEEIDGIHIYRHGLPPELNNKFGFIQEYLAALWHETRLAWRVRRERGFDIIHACNPPDLIFLVAAPFKFLFGTKFLFDQHDVNPELYETKFGRRDIAYKALLLVERLTFALADAVISTNESYRKIALTRGGKREDQVFVVRSAPRLDKFKLRPGGEKHRSGFKYVVGYLGVMGPQEGIDYLLRSVKRIVEGTDGKGGRTDIKFMLIGGGSSLEDLKALSRELKLEQYVEFTGRIPDEELLERLTICDVCVNPDPMNPLNNISTMNKIMEYMALGKPIVQFDLIEGRCSAADASLYAKPNDEADFAEKILEFLENPNQRERMGQIGMERMKTALSWEHSVPKLLEAYTKALVGSRTTKRTVKQS
jgi:glycosyltransferase involved in cell wall biosynthesis